MTDQNPQLSFDVGSLPLAEAKDLAKIALTKIDDNVPVAAEVTRAVEFLEELLEWLS